MKLNRRKIFIFLILFLLGSFSAFAQSKFIIKIAPETTIETDLINLSDIAQISGFDETKLNRLKSISLGYAPNVGMIRELFQEKILISIAAAGISKKDFSIDAPAKIFVRRSAHNVGQELLRESIEKALLADFRRNNVTAQIVRLDLPTNLQVPAGNIEVRVKPVNIANLFAPFSVSIEIRVAEKTVRHISVTVQLEATAEVLVAAKDLVAGKKVNVADLIKETRRLEKPVANYLRDVENLRGMVLVKNVSAGTEITTDSFASGYVIRSGDLVRIIAESGKLQISIGGEAKASGRIGGRISVKNLQSGAILQAVVIDEGLVKIIF